MLLKTTVDCTSISDKQELEKAVAEIGDWETLCENLGVPNSVINGLRYSNKQTTRKKSDCLEAYLDTDEACWQKVVMVVAEHPFNKRRLAKRIANTYYGKDYSSIIKEGRNLAHYKCKYVYLLVHIHVCIRGCICMGDPQGNISNVAWFLVLSPFSQHWEPG